MNKLIAILLMTFILAGELEVDGDLTVTGAIQSPTIDALGGMKPERIYQWFYEQDGDINVQVPENKIWYIVVSPQHFGSDSYSSYIAINNNFIKIGNLRAGGSQCVFSLLPGTFLYTDTGQYYPPNFINIYEYPISGSGTDQGMPYIEP